MDTHKSEEITKTNAPYTQVKMKAFELLTFSAWRRGNPKLEQKSTAGTNFFMGQRR